MSTINMEERRQAEMRIEGAYGLAILYTLGFLMMVGMLMFFEIPKDNRELLISLIGIMSAAQLGIIKFYFDGSKAAQQVQQAAIIRNARNDAVIQDLAKSAPTATAAAVAASVASGIQSPSSPNAATSTQQPTNGEGQRS